MKLKLPDVEFVRRACSRWRYVTISGMAHVFMLENYPGGRTRTAGRVRKGQHVSDLYKQVVIRLRALTKRMLRDGHLRVRRQWPIEWPSHSSNNVGYMLREPDDEPTEQDEP